MTVTLGSDVTLTATVVVGSSDYDGMFPEAQTVASHDVTIDLTATPSPAPPARRAGGPGGLHPDHCGQLRGQDRRAGQRCRGGRRRGRGRHLQRPAPANPFTDVPESAYYYAPVQWAVAQGITTGRTETTFAPGENCTRAQLATFLWRAAGEPEPALTEQQFMDVADPGAYYYKAVQWAAEKDMWGFGTFPPNDRVYPAGRGVLPVARRRQPGDGRAASLCRRPLRRRG